MKKNNRNTIKHIWLYGFRTRSSDKDQITWVITITRTRSKDWLGPRTVLSKESHGQTKLMEVFQGHPVQCMHGCYG